MAQKILVNKLHSQCVSQIHFCESWQGKFWWISHDFPNSPIFPVSKFSGVQWSISWRGFDFMIVYTAQQGGGELTSRYRHHAQVIKMGTTDMPDERDTWKRMCTYQENLRCASYNLYVPCLGSAVCIVSWYNNELWVLFITFCVWLSPKSEDIGACLCEVI